MIIYSRKKAGGHAPTASYWNLSPFADDQWLLASSEHGLQSLYLIGLQLRVVTKLE